MEKEHKGDVGVGFYGDTGIGMPQRQPPLVEEAY